MVLSSQTEYQYSSSHGEDSPSDYTEQNHSVSNTGSAMAERENSDPGTEVTSVVSGKT